MPDGRSHCMSRWLLLSLLSTPRNHLSYWVPSPRPRAALDPTTVLQGQLYPAPSDVTPRVRATKEDGYVLGSESNSYDLWWDWNNVYKVTMDVRTNVYVHNPIPGGFYAQGLT